MMPLFVFKDSWPSSSPGLNRCRLLDVGRHQADSDAVTHNSVDDLKDVMESDFRSSKVNHVKRACVSFRDHTEKVVTASGAFIA